MFLPSMSVINLTVKRNNNNNNNKETMSVTKMDRMTIFKKESNLVYQIETKRFN